MQAFCTDLTHAAKSTAVSRFTAGISLNASTSVGAFLYPSRAYVVVITHTAHRSPSLRRHDTMAA